MLLTNDAAVIKDGIENLQNVDKNVIEEYLDALIPKALNFALSVVLAALLYVIGQRVIGFVRKILRRSLERRDVDIGVRQFLDSVVKWLLYLFLCLMILTIFGITTASVVAVLGSAGLTLGLALQGSLANFAGGVLILLLKPFHVGDYIIAHSTGNEGTVKEISAFYTKILTFDNRTVMIPNGKLADGAITNVTGQQTRRVDLLVDISYDADIRKAKELLAGLVADDPRILPEEETDIFVSELGESSVKLGCRFWVNTDDYWGTRWDMLERIKYTFDGHGIEIPYQKLDVQVQEPGSAHERNAQDKK